MHVKRITDALVLLRFFVRYSSRQLIYQPANLGILDFRLDGQEVLVIGAARKGIGLD